MGTHADHGGPQKVRITKALLAEQTATHDAELGTKVTRMDHNQTKRKEFEAQGLLQIEGLYRTALYVLNDESAAQDLVRESYAEAFRSWHEYEANPDCRTWLFKTMMNVNIDKYGISPGRSATVTASGENNEYSMNPLWVNQHSIDDSGCIAFPAISQNHVMIAIVNLPYDFRLVVVLSQVEGFSYREIADIIGLNLETVRSRLHHGRKVMQRELFNHVGCEGIYDKPADRVRSRNSAS